LYDSRDGKTYKTVVIGTQTWMAENLNYEVTGSFCYSGDSNNCDTYGRFYNWATALGLTSTCNNNFCADQVPAKRQGVCPSGWHLPSDAEWDVLVTFAGTNPGTKLKASSGWNGTDEFGFSALPGGTYNSGNFNFYFVGDHGYWWSATEGGSANLAWIRSMRSNLSDVDRFSNGKSYRSSVRCVED
jgi:uncharacterized protein (TIGR02145 family)